MHTFTSSEVNGAESQGTGGEALKDISIGYWQLQHIPQVELETGISCNALTQKRMHDIKHCVISMGINQWLFELKHTARCVRCEGKPISLKPITSTYVLSTYLRAECHIKLFKV